MLEFRHIEEGEGATLLIDSTVPAVGTWNLITCVGVYFRIDATRCFVAHINAFCFTTYPYNVVTTTKGLEIAEQVEKALRKLANQSEWDEREQYFGKNLILQSPALNEYVVDGHQYDRSAKYIVQGIHNFFKNCAGRLHDEAKQRSADPERNELDEKSQELEAKATFLNDQVNVTQVDKTHHCFIVAPSTGEVIRLGVVKPSNGSENLIKLEDLGEHSPVSVPGRSYNFFFGPLFDDVSAFHPSLLTKIDVSDLVREVMSAVDRAG